MDLKLEKVKMLEGILPICCICKKIRDDAGNWNQVELYMCQHANAKFSHGYCPDCFDKVMADFGLPTAPPACRLEG